MTQATEKQDSTRSLTIREREAIIYAQKNVASVNKAFDDGLITEEDHKGWMERYVFFQKSQEAH